MTLALFDPNELSHWHDAPVSDVIAYLVSHFHEVHREQLPALIALSRKVERVHADHPMCPVGLADALEALYQELESHMLKEEQVLFPMLARGLSEQLRAPVSVMRMEHDEQDKAVAALESITGNGLLPDDACGSWRRLYYDLDAFRIDLVRHIRLENEVLFDPISYAVEGARHA